MPEMPEIGKRKETLLLLLVLFFPLGGREKGFGNFLFASEEEVLRRTEAEESFPGREGEGLPTSSRSSIEEGKRRGRLAHVEEWVCYYGSNREVLAIPGKDLLILDADSIGPLTQEEKKGRICLAYLSLGEAESYRWFWDEIKDEPWIGGENPHWPGAHLIDVRAEAWQSLLIKRVARRHLERGYDGFLLDTLDTADTLMNHEPLLYEGVHSAMVTIVRRLREAYPHAILVANGGLSMIRGTAPYLDGVLYEGIYSTYDFTTKTYRRRTDAERTWIQERLSRVIPYELPILALEYVDPSHPEEAASIEAMARAAGFPPYLTQIDLHSFPGEKR